MRPALIIQNNTGNAHASTTIVAAITTTLKMFPVTVVVETKESGLKQRSMVNLAQILTIDRNRLLKRIGAPSASRVAEVDQAIKISLGLGF